MLIGDSLSADTIEIGQGSNSAAELIARLAARLSAPLGVPARQLEQAVLERERARTTALPNRAAIPHCRLPDLPRFGIAISVLREPVTWDNEGHAVDVVMLIAAPSRSVSDHLRILANSSQLLDSPSLREKLRRAPDAACAYALIAAAENAVEGRRAQVGVLREVRKDGERPSVTDYLSEVAQRFDW